MAADPRIRASDDDRDRTASLLREHHAAGRLDAEEFNERLDRTYAAKTMGELDEILSDLPAIDLYRLPHEGVRRGRRNIPGAGSYLAAAAEQGALAHPHGRFSPAWRAVWGSWFTISLILAVIWALAGHGFPWFLWVTGPWGAILLGRWIFGNGPHGGPHGGHGGPSGPSRHGQVPGDHDQLGGTPPG
jgi:Domain of unknown function (DUF1707)